MSRKAVRILMKRCDKIQLTNFCQNMSSSTDFIAKEQNFNAHNYHPIPAVICKGQGTEVWDVEGKRYLDFIASFASLNLGHTHPKILNVLKEQAGILAHTSRAYHNNILPEFAEFATKYFNYDRVLAMNTGVEGGESAVKIARRWGYWKKKIPDMKAIVVFAEKNFWGRTLSAISTSATPISRDHFGPYMPGFQVVPYDDIECLETALKNPNVCAFMVEPIQGEAGVVVPNDGYLKEVRRICTENNVLWIADEVQTGLGRTGALLAVDHEGVRPDILIIGKALGGGYLPISAVFSTNDIMDVLKPGSHGSTFGGNPLAAKVAMETLKIIQEEGIIENSRKLGEKFRNELRRRLNEDIVPVVRGKGLMNAICINSEYSTAWDLCLKLKDLGLITKNCDDYIVRFTPPLNISEDQLCEGINIIDEAVNSLKK